MAENQNIPLENFVGANNALQIRIISGADGADALRDFLSAARNHTPMSKPDAAKLKESFYTKTRENLDKTTAPEAQKAIIDAAGRLDGEKDHMAYTSPTQGYRITDMLQAYFEDRASGDTIKENRAFGMLHTLYDSITREAFQNAPPPPPPVDPQLKAVLANLTPKDLSMLRDTGITIQKDGADIKIKHLDNGEYLPPSETFMGKIKFGDKPQVLDELGRDITTQANIPEGVLKKAAELHLPVIDISQSQWGGTFILHPENTPSAKPVEKPKGKE